MISHQTMIVLTKAATRKTTATTAGTIKASSVLEHYESLVNSGEVSNDIHQIRALTEFLDRLRDDCLGYINSPLFHEKGATDNDDGRW